MTNMKVKRTKHFPFGDFIMMNVFGTLFVKGDRVIRGVDYVHESIHTAQMKDFCPWLPLGGTIFYIVYFFEWLWRVIAPPYNTAYMDISFEVEARKCERKGYAYLETRERFAQWKHH